MCQISWKSKNEKVVFVHIYHLVQRRRKFDKFHEPISLGRFLSNLVCEVQYMKALKYVSWVESVQSVLSYGGLKLAT